MKMDPKRRFVDQERKLFDPSFTTFSHFILPIKNNKNNRIKESARYLSDLKKCKWLFIKISHFVLEMYYKALRKLPKILYKVLLLFLKKSNVIRVLK